MFSCNLQPALLAEWPWSFTWYCSNHNPGGGVRNTEVRVSAESWEYCERGEAPLTNACVSTAGGWPGQSRGGDGQLHAPGGLPAQSLRSCLGHSAPVHQRVPDQQHGRQWARWGPVQLLPWQPERPSVPPQPVHRRGRGPAHQTLCCARDEERFHDQVWRSAQGGLILGWGGWREGGLCEIVVMSVWVMRVGALRLCWGESVQSRACGVPQLQSPGAVCNACVVLKGIGTWQNPWGSPTSVSWCCV